MSLQGDHEYIDIVVSSERMFMRVDEIVREFIADWSHAFFGVDSSSEEVVDAVEAALKWEVGLFFKINLVLASLFLHFPNIKYKYLILLQFQSLFIWITKNN